MESLPRNELDRIMSEETVILEGLTSAVQAGRITEEEKAEWLSHYIDARNAERMIYKGIVNTLDPTEASQT